MSSFCGGIDNAAIRSVVDPVASLCHPGSARKQQMYAALQYWMSAEFGVDAVMLQPKYNTV